MIQVSKNSSIFFQKESSVRKSPAAKIKSFLMTLINQMLKQRLQKQLNLKLNLNWLALHFYEGFKRDFKVIKEVHILKVEGDWGESSEKFGKIILDKVFRTK